MSINVNKNPKYREMNNQMAGRSGSGVPVKKGPAVPGSGIKKNPTKKGNIVRNARGKGV